MLTQNTSFNTSCKRKIDGRVTLVKTRCVSKVKVRVSYVLHTSAVKRHECCTSWVFAVSTV